MPFKSYVKKFIPKFAFTLKNAFLLSREDKKYRNLFLKSYADIKHPNIDVMRTLLIYDSHPIEKGLSHTKFRYGFGKKALTNMRRDLDIWRKNNYPLDDQSYLTALSILKAYVEKSLQINGKIPDFFDELFAPFKDQITKSPLDYGGSKVTPRCPNPDKQNFRELMESRFSTREFLDTEVDLGKIYDAVDIAMRSPSVCNRQPTRVYIVRSPQKIKNIIAIQCGFRSYKEPPVLIAITSSLSSFVNIHESHEPYVDGGIFGMSLMLSLQYEGLGYCPLNAMTSFANKKKMRQILGIPSSEELIFFLAVGNESDDIYHTVSKRKSYKEIVTVI